MHCAMDSFSAQQGRNKSAQGNALGMESNFAPWGRGKLEPPCKMSLYNYLPSLICLKRGGLNMNSLDCPSTPPPTAVPSVT